MVIDLLPAVRKEPDHAVTDGVPGLCGLRIFQEPLFTQARFHRNICPLAEPDIVLVRLLLGEKTQFAKTLHRFHPGLEAVQPCKAFTGKIVEPPVGIHDVDDGKVVAQSDLVVGLVVRRRNLQDARSEFKIHRIVPDDREQGFRLQRKRATHVHPDKVCIAFILRAHSDRRVAHDGLRTCRGNFEPGAGLLNDLQFEMVKVSLLLFGDDFLIAQRGKGDRAPVDHSPTAVDKALGVQINEDLLYLAGIGLIHSESLACPVTGAAEFLELLDDDTTVLFLPLPDLLEKINPSKIMSGFLFLLAEHPFHHCLGGNACMVGSRQPQDLMTGLPSTSGKDVL